MVIDTSAIAAIMFAEPEAPRFAEAIEMERSRFISAVTWVETGVVVETRQGQSGRTRLERFLQLTALEIVAVSAPQAEIALDAFRRFGKGRHRAALNFGDCFTYALAKSMNLPPLFKGGDFIHTDLRPALPQGHAAAPA